MAARASRPGRLPRAEVARRERELLEATIELLVEVGYGGLTVDAVVARAHASKATVYRRWSSKADLVVAAIAARLPPRELESVEPDDLREAVRSIVAGIVRELTELRTVVSTVLEEQRRNRELRELVQRELVSPWRTALIAALRRAGAAPDEVELLWQVVPGVVLLRIMMLEPELGSELSDQLTELLLSRTAV